MAKIIFKESCIRTQSETIQVTKSRLDSDNIYIECSDENDEYIGVLLNKEIALKLCEAIQNNYK